MQMNGQIHALTTLPLGKETLSPTKYPLYRSSGETQSWSGHSGEEKNSCCGLLDCDVMYSEDENSKALRNITRQTTTWIFNAVKNLKSCIRKIPAHSKNQVLVIQTIACHSLYWLTEKNLWWVSFDNMKLWFHSYVHECSLMLLLKPPKWKS